MAMVRGFLLGEQRILRDAAFLLSSQDLLWVALFIVAVLPTRWPLEWDVGVPDPLL